MRYQTKVMRPETEEDREKREDRELNMMLAKVRRLCAEIDAILKKEHHEEVC